MMVNKFLLIIIIIIITICSVWFLVTPQYKQFKILQTEVSLKEAEYNAKYEYYAEVMKVFSQLEKRQDGLNKIDKALPDNISLAPIIYFLQKKTSESGLIVKDLFFTKASAVSPKDPIKEILFSINVIGNYSSLKNFLLSLEKSANLFEVNSISFSSSPLINIADQSTQSHSFLLEIKTNSY